MNKGVFETIRVWASQGWVLQSVFFCELPLGDHHRDEVSDIGPSNELDHAVSVRSNGSNGHDIFGSVKSHSGSSASVKSARLQITKCKYAMRYHSLLYFARPSAAADAVDLQGADGCIQGL